MLLYFLAIGVVIIVLSLFLDGIFDFDGDGWFFSAGVALASFGGLGSIFLGAKMNVVLSILLSLVFAAFITSLMVYLIRKMKAFTDSPDNDFSDKIDFLNKEGKVVWWNGNKGEIDVVVMGELHRCHVVSLEPMTVDKDDSLKIVSLGAEDELVVEKS